MKSFNPKGILVAAVAAAAVTAGAHAADISGAGATFPYPIYSKWADAYKKQTGVGLNYQSIGSGGGIKQIKAKTVTFGASDMPLKPEEVKQAGLVQFPMIIGGVVPAVNVKGVQPGQMVLDGVTVASIYLGEIDRKSTRLNSSHDQISYAVFCLKKKRSCRSASRRRCASRVSAAAQGSRPSPPGARRSS